MTQILSQVLPLTSVLDQIDRQVELSPEELQPLDLVDGADELGHPKQVGGLAPVRLLVRCQGLEGARPSP